MYTKHLSVKKLYPPFVSGGLWRTWYLLPSVGIRHHLPEVFGGTNHKTSKDLTNIRHLAAKRESSIIIFDGSRKKIYELKKNLRKY